MGSSNRAPPCFPVPSADRPSAAPVTIASGGKRDARRRAAAEVATKLFGTTVPPENVVDETLRRAIQVPVPQDTAEIRKAVEAPIPIDVPSFVQAPLAAWTENVFGLDEEDGSWQPHTPQAPSAGC